MNDMPLYSKDKPLEIYVEQLSFRISSLSADLAKANNKILDLYKMIDNCMAIVTIQQVEKRMEYKEHEEFIAGGSD